MKGMTMSDELAAAVIGGWARSFGSARKMAEGAIGQLDDEQLFQRPAPGFNSVAAIIKHLAGNVRSRWTDWRTTDGEKPWRNRETEFDVDGLGRAEIDRLWTELWDTLERELAAMSAEDLGLTVTIRGEAHTVPDAVDRQLMHMGYHVGQIMLVSRLIVGDGWRWQTIRPGGSDGFNRQMQEQFGPRLGSQKDTES